MLNRLLPVMITATAVTPLLHAQWTVANLQPATATRSRAQASGDNRQAGYCFIGGRDRATAWTGTSASALDLHPASAAYSRIYSMSGGVGGDGVGVARFSLDHAALWHGPSLSFVDLHPLSGFSSVGYGTDGVQQVGIVYIGTPPAGQYHASVWTGTAASWVSLNPATPGSFAYAVHDGQQVGYADMGGFVQHASLWTGTAGSWVDIHPMTSSYSIAFAVYAGRQGGIAEVGGVDHASLWSGTADSWLDVHPTAAGATDSSINGMGDGVQVGSAAIGGVRHAGLWAGSAASWVDLSTFLTGSWSDSEAQNVWVGGGLVHVAGWGHNLTTNRDEALLWTGPIPTPACDPIDFNGDGLFPDTQDITDFLSVFAGGVCSGQLPADPPCNIDIDFNNDGLFPDTADIDSLLRVFSGGPCT